MSSSRVFSSLALLMRFSKRGGTEKSTWWSRLTSWMNIQRVAEELSQKFHGVEEDDKFLACAVAGSAEYIITGDGHLLKVSRYGNVEIVNPPRL